MRFCCSEKSFCILRFPFAIIIIVFFFFFLSVNENDMMVVMLKNRGFLDKKKKTSIYLRKYENLGSVGLIRFFFRI